MGASLSRLLGALLTPPAGLLLLIAAGLVVAVRRRRLGLSIAGGALALLWLLASPWVAGRLLASLQTSPALPAEGSSEPLPAGVQAIVVLAAGFNPAGYEYGGDGLDRLTLERVHYAAHLARRTGLPVLTSGGVPERERPSMAALMKRVLQRDYGIEECWTEPLSRNTRDNATISAPILFAAGVERVYLVTHAWHMPRAAAEFRRAGLDVVPAPTGFRVRPRLEASSFWPYARSLRESAWAFHEWLGRAWYALSG